VLGILSAAMGLKGFLLSSSFIDGGVTGVSMLLAKLTRAPLSIWLPIVNAPFIIVGYRQMGRAFAVRSALAIAGLAAALATMHFPDVTPDRLLTAVFGGFFIGAGIGLAVRGGAVLDGTEIAAPHQQRRSPEGRRSHPRLQRRAVYRDVGARRRAGALFDPHPRDRGQDAQLRHLA
jgi:uncharacterized membrane-anchored protein YitT (DUF2179 family)